MHIPFKRQLIILISLITLVATVITVAIIVPAVRAILALERDIGQTETFLEQQYQRTRELRRSTQAVDELMLQIKQLDGAAMKKGDELRLIKRLEQLAAAHQIEQTLVVNFTEVPAAPLRTEAKSRTINQSHYTFSFLNQGTFANHIRFLRALETWPEYFVIHRLNWEKRQPGPEAPAPITLRFDATVYVWPSSS